MHTGEPEQPARPLAIVRAGGDALAEGRRLAALHPGPEIDLRRAPVPVVPEDVRRAVAQAAAERTEADAREHERRGGELRAASEAAEAARAGAEADVDAARAVHGRLSDAIAWCELQQVALPGLLDAAAAADAVEEEAQRRLAAADGRLAAVTEQRGAAEGVLGEARRQLASLEFAGHGENDLRRSLEQAMQSLRAAEAEEQAAQARCDQATADLGAAAIRLRTAHEALVGWKAVAAGDAAAVASALERVEASGFLPATPEDLALADRFERLLVEADRDPSLRDLDGARRALREAEAAAARLLAPTEHVVPPWWHELARLHAEVVEAEAGVMGVVVRRAATRRLEAAVAAERAFLDELGYPSHLDALLSGGRPHGAPRGARAGADANQARDAAERRLRLAEELHRVRDLAAGRTGRRDEVVTPDDLRRPHPNLVARAELARAIGIDDGPDLDLVALGRAWLAHHADAAAGIATAAEQRREAAHDLAAGDAALDVAQAELEAAAAVAAEARRRAAVVEGELGSRIGGPTDPITRAARAAALRDQIGALEARVTTAESAAAAERGEAADALAAATAARVTSRRALVAVADGLADLDPVLSHPLPRTDDIDADLRAAEGALRRALDPAASAVEVAVARAVDATRAAIEARTALEEHRPLVPGSITPAVLAFALGRVLDPAARPSDVVVEPLAALDGDDPAARAALLQALVDAGRRRPLVVLTDDPALLSWAIDLAPDAGALVPIAELQSGPASADEQSASAPASPGT